MSISNPLSIFPLALLCAAGLVACTDHDAEDADAIGCTTQYVPGIQVEIYDDLTDVPLAAYADATVVSDTISEALQISGWLANGDPASAYLMSGAYETPGRYDVQIKVDGYEDWTRADVTVTQGICHVETVTLTARMVQQGAAP